MSLVSGLVFDTFLGHDVPSGVTREHSKRVAAHMHHGRAQSSGLEAAQLWPRWDTSRGCLA